MKKSSKAVILVAVFAVIVALDILVVSKIARNSFTAKSREQMNLHAELRTLEFEASMNEQLTLVRQMVKTPSIVKYLINPKDMDNRPVAFEDFLAFQNSFLSKSVFWTSDADLEFWSGMEYSYTVNPNSPNDYWYNMTLYETDEYNFNINYNPTLGTTNLWVNAVVKDNGTPIGIVGTGIPLTDMIHDMYDGLDDSILMYLYNNSLEITGALDNSILEKIMSELSGLKSEINNLKFDFETLKSQESESEAESGTDAFVPVSETSDEVFEAPETQAETEFEENSSDVTEEEIPLPEIPEPETNGFFSGDDQDETIALSGNELDNIMNTADFTEVHEESAETEEVPVESSAYSETEETADTDSKEENPFEETPEITMEEFSPLEEKLSSDLEVSDEEVSSFEDETAEDSDTPEAESFDTDFTDSTPFGDLAEGADDSEHSETDSGLSIDMNNESLEEPDLSSLETDGLESEITIPKVDDISESTEEGSSSILVESSGDDFMDSVSDSEQPEAPVFEAAETASNELSEEAAPLFDESESLDSLLGSETEPEQPAENTENEIPSVTDFAELSEESPAEPVLEDTDSSAEEIAEESPAEEAAEIPESEEVQPAAETEIAGTVEADTDTFEELSLEDSSIDSFLAPEAEISDSLSEENVNYLNEGENFAESDAESMEKTAAESETSKEAIPEKNEKSVPAAATETDKPVSAELKNDIRSVLLYMDQLLENLPEDKIVEFAKSEQFTTYKRLFSELGLS